MSLKLLTEHASVLSTVACACYIVSRSRENESKVKKNLGLVGTKPNFLCFAKKTTFSANDFFHPPKFSQLSPKFKDILDIY